MDEPILILAVMVTLALGGLAVLCGLVGLGLWCVGHTRLLAPFITFIPTLALLGAVGGSWGLGYLVATVGGPEFYGQAWWAWSVGLPVGGVLGGLFGLLLARLFRKKDGTAESRPVAAIAQLASDCIQP